MIDKERILEALKIFNGNNVILYNGIGDETVTFQDVVDFICRLQSEDEKLLKDYYSECQTCDEQKDIIEKQKAEIERLTEERDMYADDLYWKAEVRKRENFITELTVENAELQKQVDELKKRCEIAEGTKRRLTIFDRIEIHDKAVKDTAKEILQGILSNCKMAKEKIVNTVVNEDSGYRLGYVKAIEHYTDFILCVAKEKGVEVE